MQIQAALTTPDATDVVFALMVLGTVALAADYAHMLYLHYRMVSLLWMSFELLLNFDSHQVHYHGRLLATHGHFLTINHGSISRLWQSSIKLP